MKKHLPLVELYSPMYRLVKYRTTTAATERKGSISLANDLANDLAPMLRARDRNYKQSD